MRTRLASALPNPKPFERRDDLPAPPVRAGTDAEASWLCSVVGQPFLAAAGFPAGAGLVTLSIFFLAALPLTAREEVTRDVQKTATLRPNQHVSIDHRLGDIVIHTTSSSNATIAARFRVSAPSRSEAQRFADATEIVVSDSGGELAISTRYPESDHDVSFGASYEITVPESAPLRVTNRFGSVRVTGLKADSDIRNAQGSIEFTDSRGTQRMENRFGSISVRNNTGDVSVINANASVTLSDVTGKLDIRNQFGAVSVTRAGSDVKIDNRNARVDVDDARGDATVINSFGPVTITRVGKVMLENRNGAIDDRDARGYADLRTSFGSVRASDLHSGARIANRNGNVDLTNVTGDAYLTSSFGRITAATVSGALTIGNQNGAIEVRSTQGAVRASTSFGPIALDQVSAGVDATNHNGAVTIHLIPGSGKSCQPVIARASFGPIRVSLPANANYDFTANTSFGQIHSEFPVSVYGKLDGRSVTGKIGAGGCQLDLSNRNGGIDLLKGATR